LNFFILYRSVSRVTRSSLAACVWLPFVFSSVRASRPFVAAAAQGLNEVGSTPLWLLDTTVTGPRIVFVPVKASE
jgi:hypothetical protein